MITLVAVAAGIPVLVLLACLGMRRIQSLPFARTLALARGGDMRGIALQTIIVMVVLLAIAGAVAGVLLARGSEETDRLDEVESVDYEDITSYTLCKSAGGFSSDEAVGVANNDAEVDSDDFESCKAP